MPLKRALLATALLAALSATAARADDAADLAACLDENIDGSVCSGLILARCEADALDGGPSAAAACLDRERRAWEAFIDSESDSLIAMSGDRAAGLAEANRLWERSRAADCAVTAGLTEAFRNGWDLQWLASCLHGKTVDRALWLHRFRDLPL